MIINNDSCLFKVSSFLKLKIKTDDSLSECFHRYDMIWFQKT